MVFLDPSHSDFVLDRSRAFLRRAPAPSKPTSLSERTVAAARQVLEGQRLGRRRYLAFAGPTIVASIAYMDPGNFATNVQAGANYGYSLLWVVLLANLVAMLFQGLSAKLGIVTGRNLAEMCREECPRPIVWAMWVVSEFAAMATDLAEFLGGAIGLSLLFHIPLWGGMAVTAVTVYGVLLTERRGFRPLELIIGSLVGVIALCYLIELLIAPVDWGSAALHMVLPHIADNEALLLAVGIIGATVMPHAIYLHSGLTQARIRDIRKRGENPDLDRRLGLRPRRHCQEAPQARSLALHIAPRPLSHAFRETTVRSGTYPRRSQRRYFANN